jgi:hypothetical protein
MAHLLFLFRVGVGLLRIPEFLSILMGALLSGNITLFVRYFNIHFNGLEFLDFFCFVLPVCMVISHHKQGHRKNKAYLKPGTRKG